MPAINKACLKACLSIGICLLLVLFLEVSPKAAHAAIQATYYVSPTGSDTNPGTQALPFATMTKARDVVRTINGNMTGDIYVYIAAGTYYVTSTITFNENDSGTNGFRVIYTNLDGLGTAKFIGGTKVTSEWNAVTRTSADADLPAGAEGYVYKAHVGTGVDFNTLYVNDARATMARTKNKTLDPRFPSQASEYMRSEAGGISNLKYISGDLDAVSLTGLTNAQSRGDLDAQVYMWDGGYWDWMTDTIPIASIDTSTRTITYKTDPSNPAAYRPHFLTLDRARYFLQGNLGFLDQPGEYYFNKTTGYLYYYPLTGSGSLSNQDIVIPSIDKVIEVKGSSRTSQVSHITFNGLELKDTNFPDYYSYGWNKFDANAGIGFYPPEALAPGVTQPSYSHTAERVEFQAGVITLTNTNHITLSNTRIKNAGLFGINLYLANQYTSITNSLIENTGHGGIQLDGGYPGVGGDANGDGYNSHNTITNSIIHDVGQLVGQAAGVTVISSGYNTVSHSEIYNSPRRAIFVSHVGKSNDDSTYDPMKHMYTHHNTFSHLYLHDLQQDGGDDGGLFVNDLWLNTTHYKPNYFNQILIDAVGANPSMKDIAPNGINVDGRTPGVEFSNVKSVNPQHFNWELNTLVQYGSPMPLTNINADFGTVANHIDTFDDSLMDYDNIGVDVGFPSVYLPIRSTFQEPADLYFKDDFENGNGIDFTKWTFRGSSPSVTTQWMSEGVMHGKAALQIDSDRTVTGPKPVLYRDFGASLNKIVTVKLFDRQSSNLVPYSSGAIISSTVKSLARVDNGVHKVGLGLDTTVDGNYYVFMDGSTKTPTSVRRSYGWHELKWDYTSGNDVKLYIDGVLVQTLNTLSSFSRVELGSDDGKGVGFYDQVYIYGGTTASPPAKLTVTLPGTMGAEWYDAMNGIVLEPSSEGGLNASDIETGDWMEFNVNVQSAGTYIVDYGVAVDPGYTGEVQFQVGGVNLKTTSFPSTGGGQNWTTVRDTVTLSAGPQTIRLYASQSGWNINWFRISTVTPGTNTIQAENYDSQIGTMTSGTGTGAVVGNLSTGSRLVYKNIDFGTGVNYFTASVAVDPAFAGKQLQLRLDSPMGTLIGTLTIDSTGGWGTFATRAIPVSGVSGVHDLYIVGAGGEGIGNLDWFKFSKPVPGTDLMQAEGYLSSSGTMTHSAGTGTVVGNLSTGSWMRYVNLDFGTGVNQFIASVGVDSAYAGKQLELRLDSPTGTLAGLLVILPTGGWDTYATQTTAVSGVSGVHDLYIVGAGGEGIGNLDWFKFSNSSMSTVQAESYNSQSGTMTHSAGTGMVVGNLSTGSWMKYNNINFGTGINQFTAFVGVDPAYAGKQLQLRLDSPTGTLIGILTINATGGWDTYTVQTTGVSGASGVRDLYIVGAGGEGIGNIDWFKLI